MTAGMAKDMLKDQVVLVTGCSTGIGRAFVEELKALGHRPFASARRAQSVEELQQAGFDTVTLDVNDPESAERACAEVVERAGRLDVVINNAGFNIYGPLVEVPFEELQRIFQTNVLGVVAVCQAAFPHMVKQRRGRIINVGSVVGVLPTPYAAAYCATKSAVHTLSEVLRQEVSPFGIEVVVVQPGAVRSAIAQTGADKLQDYLSDDSRYRAVREDIEKRAWASQENPMDTGEFARVTLTEALSVAPPRVVRAGTGANVLPLLGKIPGPARDLIMAKRFGLEKLRSEG